MFNTTDVTHVTYDRPDTCDIWHIWHERHATWHHKYDTCATFFSIQADKRMSSKRKSAETVSPPVLPPQRKSSSETANLDLPPLTLGPPSPRLASLRSHSNGSTTQRVLVSEALKSPTIEPSKPRITTLHRTCNVRSDSFESNFDELIKVLCRGARLTRYLRNKKPDVFFFQVNLLSGELMWRRGPEERIEGSRTYTYPSFMYLMWPWI